METKGSLVTGQEVYRGRSWEGVLAEGSVCVGGGGGLPPS